PSDVLAHGAALVVASADAAFLAQVADTLAGARLDVSSTRDVTGVELAGAATEAAVLAAAAASVAGPNAAGAAAGKVFAEVGEYRVEAERGATALMTPTPVRRRAA